jgi:hypothetical protein
MRPIIFYVLLSAIIFTNATAQHNTLSKKEKKEGWVLLFNGKTFTGWRGYCKAGFPDKGWEVSGDAIRCVAKANGGDIIFDKKFSDFELYFEWKISPNGNGGLLYRGQEIEGQKLTFSAPQIQTLDNERNPDAQRGKNGNHKAGSLFDLLPAEPQNTRPAGEWNTFLLIVRNNRVTHIQNGSKVCEYTIGTPEWREMIAGSNFKDWALINIAAEGYIGLQDHGDDAWYRDIKIKQLKKQ